jgi:hypothetical protein
MGFAQKWIDMIIKCISIVQYSVLINGDPVGFFSTVIRNTTRRSSISLSFYHLCRSVELITSYSCSCRGFKGCSTVGGRTKNKSLFFFIADNSLLFCKANRENLNCLSGILEMYERASGQRLIKIRQQNFLAKILSRQQGISFFK